MGDLNWEEQASSPFAAEAMACLQAAKLGLDLGILTAEIEGMSYPWYGNCKITESKDIENTKSTCVGYQSCVFRHMPRQANGSAPMHGGFQEKRKVYQMFGIGPVPLRLAGFPFF